MFWFVVLSESSNIQKEVAIQQLISKLKFETARLSVENWGRILSDPSKRNKLESELKVILTPTIMYRLPLSMKFSADEDSISKWVDDRVNDVQILCVHERDTSELMGLILLFDNPEETVIPTIQLGYILGEPNWGKGTRPRWSRRCLQPWEAAPECDWLRVLIVKMSRLQLCLKNPVSGRYRSKQRLAASVLSWRLTNRQQIRELGESFRFRLSCHVIKNGVNEFGFAAFRKECFGDVDEFADSNFGWRILC